MKGLQINSEALLKRFIGLVYEKHLEAPNPSMPYVNMCKRSQFLRSP